NIEKLLEFALLVKDKKSVNPVSLLSVVPNNEEAEQNIIRSKNKLEKYVQQGSATETQVKIIATIDHNAASGIARTSREIMADFIIIGWPHRSGFLEKLIGEKVESILNNTERTLFVTHFEYPLVAHKRIIVIAPPLSEREAGFELWCNK